MLSSVRKRWLAQLQGGQALRTFLLLALALIVVTLVLERLQPLVGLALLVPYLVLVVLAALWGGLPAALFTCVAAVPIVDYFLFDPAGRLGLGSRQVLELIVVLLGGLLLGWLIDSLRAARVRAELAAESEKLALQDRDALLSVVAHDLRTPLTAVRARIQLADAALQRQPPDIAAARHSLSLALPQVDRINRLLGDLVVGARGDRGRLVVEPRPLDLAPLLERVVERWRTQTPSHAFEAKIQPSLPVLADPDRIEQVLDNLLANAVKYSPDGSAVCLSAAIQDGEVRLAVADQGPGIPPEEHERIFERFYRRPEHRAAHRPGLGLGLFITRELVEAQGGRIWVESEPGQGSTFVVTLPLRGADGAAQPSDGAR